jgi:nitrite reductase/ring-hydroxylating ferredoxin subunit
VGILIAHATNWAIGARPSRPCVLLVGDPDRLGDRAAIWSIVCPDAAAPTGWYLVAFERELTAELTPAEIGDRRLVLLRRAGEIRAFDATCPHRGAHLGLGGRVDGERIQCPFHGYRIHLGRRPREPFCVDEHPVMCAGGMVFARLSEGADHGWTAYLAALERDHHVLNGFELHVRTPGVTVIENAFDRRHFDSVHGIRTEGFSVSSTGEGALVVESLFYVPTAPAAPGRPGRVVPAPYHALVPSPGIAAVTLGGPVEYTVITGATDTSTAGACAIRLSVAFPRSAWPTPPPPAVYEPLLAHSRRGLDEDRVVWENLAPAVAPHWRPEDEPSLRFLEFCREHHGG